MTCPCGRPATHQVVRWVPSNVGTARKVERGCTRCLEATAKALLLDDERRVEVQPL